MSGRQQARLAMALAAELFAQKRPTSWVYLCTFDEFVKVGTTINDPADRIKQVAKRYGVTCRLLGAVPGDRGLEQRVLRDIQQHRVYGRYGSKEVFDLPPPVLASVAAFLGVTL